MSLDHPTVSVTCTPAERDLIRAAAAARGLSVSAWALSRLDAAVASKASCALAKQQMDELAQDDAIAPEKPVRNARVSAILPEATRIRIKVEAGLALRNAHRWAQAVLITEAKIACAQLPPAAALSALAAPPAQPATRTRRAKPEAAPQPAGAGVGLPERVETMLRGLDRAMWPGRAEGEVASAERYSAAAMVRSTVRGGMLKLCDAPACDLASLIEAHETARDVASMLILPIGFVARAVAERYRRDVAKEGAAKAKAAEPETETETEDAGDAAA